MYAYKKEDFCSLLSSAKMTAKCNFLFFPYYKKKGITMAYGLSFLQFLLERIIIKYPRQNSINWRYLTPFILKGLTGTYTLTGNDCNATCYATFISSHASLNTPFKMQKKYEYKYSKKIVYKLFSKTVFQRSIMKK